MHLWALDSANKVTGIMLNSTMDHYVYTVYACFANGMLCLLLGTETCTHEHLAAVKSLEGYNFFESGHIHSVLQNSKYIGLLLPKIRSSAITASTASCVDQSH